MKVTLFSKIFLLALLVLSLGLTAYAAGDKHKAQMQQEVADEKTAVVPVDDVEALLDKRATMNNKRVSVSGEVEEVLDQRTFILESGGLFNDEVVVFLDKGVTADDIQRLIKEDKEIIVNGTFKALSVVEIERDYDWDFKPEIEAELNKAGSYILGSELKEQLSE